MPRLLLIWIAAFSVVLGARSLPAQETAAAFEFDDGSRIGTRTLTALQTANLALLGKVWGFVKYHHPHVAAGRTNWDYALFRVMPAVLDAGDRNAALDAISGWLDEVGEPAACAPCAVLPADPHLPPAVGWIHDGMSLGAELSARLARIHHYRPASGEQHYRGSVEGVGNPDFTNEAGYETVTMPDAGFRMLALFRFWNIVEYWFPYRDVIGEDWDAVLVEFVPVLMAADDGAAYRLALIRLSARINDTHANVWRELAVRPPRGTAQLPVQVRFVEGAAVVSGSMLAEPWPAAGLQRGDVIEGLAGMAVDSLVAAWRPYYSASNEPTRLRDIARALTLGPPGPVRVAVRRDGRIVELTADRVPFASLDRTRVTVQDLPGETFQQLTEEVAYLKLSSVRTSDVDEYMRRAANARVLVVDIRNYPSEFVVFSLGGRFVERPTDFARFTRGDPANPGAFVWTPPVTLQPIEPGFRGRVVILVDETSQSQAEYTAMAFRSAPGAIVVGSTTAGADGNVSSIPLPGGISSMISGIGVFYPDRSPTQRVGIIPDLEVLPTIEGIRAGRDEVLEAGVSRALGREFRRQSLDMQVPVPPTPVAVDGVPRLVYELQVTSAAPGPLTLNGLTIVNADGGGVLASLGADALAERAAQPAAVPPAADVLTLAPGSRAVIYIELAVGAAGAALPPALAHRIEYRRGEAMETIEGARTPVSVEVAPVLGPPVRGGPWVAAYHPSWARGHRRVPYSVDGRSRIPGRFAVDWIAVDAEGRHTRGDADEVAAWLGFGAEVLAVADAEVVATRDDVTESARLSTHPDHPLEDATGNYIALDLGNGRFAFYEHLEAGSVSVAPGQRVRRGEAIAALGFTGHTTGPHLHFHVADANSPLGAEGMPFVLECFDVLGAYEDIGSLGAPWTRPATGTPLRRTHEMPAPNTVVDLSCAPSSPPRD